MCVCVIVCIYVCVSMFMISTEYFCLNILIGLQLYLSLQYTDRYHHAGDNLIPPGEQKAIVMRLWIILA